MRYERDYYGGGRGGYGDYEGYDTYEGRAGWHMGARPGAGGWNAGWSDGWNEAPGGGWSGGWGTGYAGDAGTGRFREFGGAGSERAWQSGRWSGGGADADRMRASQLMTRHPETVTPDTSLSDVAARMKDLDVGIIPVVAADENMRLAGVITDRDIVVRAVAEGKDMKKAKVRDHMTDDVGVVGMNASVHEVFDLMKRERVRRVPVVDGENRLVGIIAQADLAVDYAGLDLQRETEVEEVLERISEPARPNWGGRRPSRPTPGYDQGLIDRGLHEWVPQAGERVREGWDAVRRGARNLVDRGYDRGWR